MGRNMYVDLRDLSEDEVGAWKEAIERDSGYDFDSVVENEPCVVDDRFFEDYAQELAEDIIPGYSEQAGHWPFNCIDWEQAARELKMDYTCFDIHGNRYWFRAW